ncbi:hydroxyacid dehydrogenase [Devosia sp. 2618]|uniref:hydroxyacid dehydrogenase n=1 Tax=Devosia sp. 2618 TaxID=3156454 RepID=UPI003390ECC7
MATTTKPLIISAPEPRSIDLIFTDVAKEALYDRYRIVEVEQHKVDELPEETLAEARYILGQPPLSPELLARLQNLRCVLNVESNLINNMPYETLFQRGIHVVTTGAVFAEPVAEIGLGMALDLARGISQSDAAFRTGTELWGGDGNSTARLLSGAEVGIIGFGDLGRTLNRLLTGFRCTIRVFDPWLPPSILTDHGVVPSSLDTVLTQSDFIFVMAAVTAENKSFLDAEAFASMRKGANFILLSRADVVDFDALLAAVRSGHIQAATDVFPEEPLAADHPARSVPGLLLSAHRAGALDIAFKRMGDMVLEDMTLMDRGLPPMRCKRAERETVARMRSKPVDRN